MPRVGLTAHTVVDAAVSIADEEGLHALTLARLAQGLGVKTPSLYAHVGGIEDVRRRVAARGIRDLARVLRDAGVGVSGRDALRAAALALRNYAKEHPGAYAAAQRAPSACDEEALAAATVAVDALKDLLAGYGLRGSEAIHAARAVRASLHGFVTLEAAGGFGLAEEVDESFSRLLDMLDAGLRSIAGA